MDTSQKTILEHWLDAKRICGEAVERDGKILFPTGLKCLDDVTGGLKPGEIWVVSGKTGMGKTSLAIQIAKACVENPQNSLLFLTLEMRGWQLCLRMYSEMMNIPYLALSEGEIPISKEFATIFEKFLSGIDLEILEFGYTFKEIEAIIDKYYQTKKPDIIMLDYLQLIEWKQFKEERIAISEYTRKIQELAKKYNIAFLIVSQTRRLPSGADYSRPPDLSDLKGSGSIEQCANKVLFVYRATKEGEVPIWYIKLAKNREGKTIDQQVLFEGDRYRFKDLSESPEIQEVLREVGGEIEQ